MNIKALIENKLKCEIAALQTRLANIEAIPFNETEVEIKQPSIYGSMIDFDRLTHPQVIEVIKSIGGKWDKEPSSVGGTINYSTEVNGITFRCWSGEPPPNCKIVEVLQTIPAQPERVVTVHRLQCA